METAAPEAPMTIGQLWDPGVDSSSIVTVEAVVTSGRTAAGDAFYAQAPGGGPRSGLRVALQGALVRWPEPVGTRVALTGAVTYSAGRPILWLRDDDDGAALGASEAVIDELGGEDQGFGLVRAPGVTVESAVDPAGRADLSTGADLCGAFGALDLAWQAVGDLVGILDIDLCPRGPEDWTETTRGRPWPVLDLESARAVADGTPVVLSGVLQAAPWSTDGRWTVLQDPATGVGLWVDAEATGVAGAPGLLATWLGEIRHDDDGPRLRTWLPALLPKDAASPVTQDVPEDGARVAAIATGLGPIDAFGDRATAEGWVLDDRFGSLDALADPAEVVAWVRGTAVYAVEPQP
jgi:hypothetical protein